MSKKVVGILLGFLASLVGVVLWVILEYSGFYSGITALLMGWLFLFVYRKINKKVTKGVIWIGLIVIIAEILLGSFLTLVFKCAFNNWTLQEILSYPENRRDLYSSLFMGLLVGIFTYGVFGYYSYKRQKAEDSRNYRYRPKNNQSINADYKINSEKKEKVDRQD